MKIILMILFLLPSKKCGYEISCNETSASKHYMNAFTTYCLQILPPLECDKLLVETFCEK